MDFLFKCDVKPCTTAAQIKYHLSKDHIKVGEYHKISFYLSIYLSIYQSFSFHLYISTYTNILGIYICIFLHHSMYSLSQFSPLFLIFLFTFFRKKSFKKSITLIKVFLTSGLVLLH